jgi:hypothetical protein
MSNFFIGTVLLFLAGFVAFGAVLYISEIAKGNTEGKKPSIITLTIIMTIVVIWFLALGGLRLI